MTPAEHIARQTAAGHTRTAAIHQLREILFLSERSVWRLSNGTQTLTPAASLLLDLWHHYPAARRLWPTATAKRTTTPQ